LRAINAALTENVRTCKELLDKRQAETDQSKEESKALFEKNLELMNKLNKLRAELEESTGNTLSHALRESRLNQEISILTEQNTHLSEQLQRTTEELTAAIRAKSSELSTMRMQFEEKDEENKHMAAQLQALRERDAEVKNRTVELESKLKAAQDEQIMAEEQFRKEIANKTKLTNLYKANVDESKCKIDELTNAVEQLQEVLRNSKTQAAADLSDARQSVNAFKQERDQLVQKVAELETELTNANELLERASARSSHKTMPNAMEILSPAAAAAGAAIKEGLSLTQMWSKYVETTELLQLEQAEVRRLEGYLQQILTDIEAKAPAIQQQRVELERERRANLQLSASLEQANQEHAVLEEKTLFESRRAAYLEREQKQHRNTIEDLSRQVKKLVVEIERLRGRNVRDDASEAEDANVSVHTAAGVIATQLVTIKGVDDLVEQNIKLRAQLRELSDEREIEERERNEVQATYVQKELEGAMAELQDMREARERQANYVEAIIKQRDMFRVLYGQVCREHGISASATGDAIMSSQPTSPATVGSASITTPSNPGGLNRSISSSAF
jgi:nucleoprotein TPR